MPHNSIDLRTTTRLPGLDIEVLHRRSPDGDREEISVNLLVVPSLEAFGRFLGATNPFAFWAEATRLTWLEAVRALMSSNADQTPVKGTNVLPFLKRTQQGAVGRVTTMS